MRSEIYTKSGATVSIDWYEIQIPDSPLSVRPDCYGDDCHPFRQKWEEQTHAEKPKRACCDPRRQADGSVPGGISEFQGSRYCETCHQHFISHKFRHQVNAQTTRLHRTGHYSCFEHSLTFFIARTSLAGVLSPVQLIRLGASSKRSLKPSFRYRSTIRSVA